MIIVGGKHWLERTGGYDGLEVFLVLSLARVVWVYIYKFQVYKGHVKNWINFTSTTTRKDQKSKLNLSTYTRQEVLRNSLLSIQWLHTPTPWRLQASLGKHWNGHKTRPDHLSPSQPWQVALPQKPYSSDSYFKSLSPHSELPLVIDFFPVPQHPKAMHFPEDQGFSSLFLRASIYS